MEALHLLSHAHVRLVAVVVLVVVVVVFECAVRGFDLFFGDASSQKEHSGRNLKITPQFVAYASAADGIYRFSTKFVTVDGNSERLGEQSTNTQVCTHVG